ncbi:MAG: tyrosine-type recombinase/integrase [Polyangia bacterium]
MATRRSPTRVARIGRLSCSRSRRSSSGPAAPALAPLYQTTRHTFASQWVMNGGSVEVLAKILGHSSTSTTEHYAHLAPDFFGAKAFDMVAVDLSKPAAAVLSLRGVAAPLRLRTGTAQEDIAEQESA